MTNARQIAELFETIAPISSGIAGDELGLIYGNSEQEVRGIGCMWIATAQSIASAAQAGLNMIICHEGLWMPPQQSPWYDGPAAGDIHSNRARKELLDRHGMVGVPQPLQLGCPARRRRARSGCGGAGHRRPARGGPPEVLLGAGAARAAQRRVAVRQRCARVWASTAAACSAARPTRCGALPS